MNFHVKSLYFLDILLFVCTVVTVCNHFAIAIFIDASKLCPEVLEFWLHEIQLVDELIRLLMQIIEIFTELVQSVLILQVCVHSVKGLLLGRETLVS